MHELNNTNCKSCGEPGMRVVETTQHYTAPFGKPVPYQQSHTECDHCEMEFDVSDPEAFPNAIREAEILSVEEILKFFKEHAIPLGRVERALELPHRQISNWKSKEAWSKSGLALLRILRSYPWIIDVADKHFQEKIVQGKLLEAASGALMSRSYVQIPSVGTTTVIVSGQARGSAENKGADIESPGFSKTFVTGALAA
ncbi:MAG: hypothetical protein ABIW76_22645 [Fibrobacteria bacterium]